MRRMKKWFALMLAACIAIPITAGTMHSDMQVVHAAEAAEESLIFEQSDVEISVGAPVDVTSQFAEQTAMEEGTLVVSYTSTSDYGVQSLFSISNSSTNNNNRHFHVYIQPNGTLGCEIRNDTGFKYQFTASGAVTAGVENKIAFKADATNSVYKLFANGKLVATVKAAEQSEGYVFVDDITGIDNVQLGATKRGGAQQYTFGGTIHSIQVYNTALDDETILEAVYKEPQLGDSVSTMFDASQRDNTWVFTGGEAVQGGFDQTRGIRNYIGQFEDYIRWTIVSNSPINARQRFTFNTGKAGRTLSEVVENYETLVADFEIKAAVYMVGAEDYNQGEDKLTDFKADLKSFIDKSLALKEDSSSFAVIQKPFASKDDTTNVLIQKYCAAVDEVVETYKTDSEKYTHIVVADHFTATNTEDFKTNKLQENGKLNAQGHLEIGRQFALATSGVSGDFPRAGVSLNLVEEEQSQQYLDIQPTVTATESSLKVEIPETAGTSWKYELEMEDVLITGKADTNSFEIVDLTAGSSYVLKIQSQDGTKQLVTTKGTITADDVAVKNVQELNDNQKKIAEMVNDEEEPMTWLFMGDSITHACQYTYGYDGIAQIFEKYVKEELGRADDIVLNTAVSNANTATTIQEIDQRLDKFNPNVVSIMLGTNDASSTVAITADEFKANMVTIIEKIKKDYPNAVIILRSPTPVFDANRLPYIDSYIGKIEELAETYDLIYIDQYTALKEATTTYSSWLKEKLFPDALHPGANGHRIMANMFLKACGLWTEDSVMTNLFYDWGITEETQMMETEILVGADKIGIYVPDLEKDSGQTFGDVIVKATSQTSGQSYEASVKDGEAYAVLRNLPGETTYDVEVSGYLKNEAKQVLFASKQVTLSDELDFTEEVELLKAGSIRVAAENMTKDQPFAAGTADSSMFRIPALITLDNGDLLAAADARWTTSADRGGLDTIASVSSDNGKTWYYSFPIYFPDSNTTYPGEGVATTVIDPVIVQGPDKTIYCIADVNPSGITTADIMPAYGTGFVEIEGKWRLALTGTYTTPDESDPASYGNPENYEYYVGDFDENGFAPVLNKADGTLTQWGVDEWYNIYTVNEETGAYEETLTQTMVNDSTIIQQNAFYKDSVLHVFNTGYLWMVTSTDNGRSWGNPQILNTQIKRETDKALLASPGQGITTSDGDIVIPFYTHFGANNEYASVIWSSDNGKTWTRSNDVSGSWSSESEVVELNNGILRMFYRNGTGYVCYVDITKTDGAWTMGTGVQTSIPVCSTCNVTAIRHSETIDGKMVVMVACPGGSGRANGKIFTFLVDKDNSMELYNTFAVNEGTYAYSCMTELSNGDIGLLWENQGAAIRYDAFTFEEVTGREKNITINPEEQYVEETAAESALEITQKPDEAIATVKNEFVVEESKIVLHDRGSAGTSPSLDWFLPTAGINSVEEAEFKFTANGDYWQIYNETKNAYLTNKTSAGEFFSSDAIDMKVTASNGGFTICKAENSDRYILFLPTNMIFDTTTNYGYVTGNYELVLLEKQDTVSEDDVVPGYKAVNEITSGKKYLISHLWGTDTETKEDDGVIVLYPTNGTANQTKLVGDQVDVTKNVLTITGVAPGETTAVVGDVTYNITVLDPAEDPSYAGNDYPVENLVAISDSQYLPGNANEGPDDYILDGKESTHWHTNWNTEEGKSVAYRWVGVSLKEAAAISGIRYLPRQYGNTNGSITEYKIQYRSTDDGEWIDITSGTWDIADSEWKLVTFDAVTAKQVRIVGVHTYSDVGNDAHMSTAEFRVVVAGNVKEEESQVVRIFGADRNETSYKVADAFKDELGIEKFDTVIVATGRAFADALSGSYLSVLKDAPILLTNGKEKNVEKLCEYIDANLNADGMIYILGGEDAVSPKVEAVLDADYDVKRLAGNSRYETSIEILKEAGVEEGTDLIVATGKDFADSLSASAVKKPILLVKPNAALTDAQKEVAAKAGQIYIVGGTNAVTETTENELKAIGNVKRIAGSGRQETSKLVAEEFFGEVETVVLAKAMDFPDGLCGGPLAAAMDAPLLLTRDNKSDIAEDYVRDNGIESGIVLGGTDALADQTAVDVFALESPDDIVLK